MDDYISYLNKVIPEKDSLKIVKSEAEKFQSSHSSSECHTMGITLYQSDNFQIQEIESSFLDMPHMKFPNP